MQYNGIFAQSGTDPTSLNVFFKSFCNWFARQPGNFILLGILLCVAIIIAVFLNWILSFTASKFTKNSKQDTAGIMLDAVRKPLFWLVLLSGLEAGFLALELSSSASSSITRVYEAAITFVVVWGLLRIIKVLSDYFLRFAQNAHAEYNELLIGLLRRIVKSIVWIIAILFAAKNIFALDISAMLAGAGVLGLAIAFAAQSTIANVFGAITLILDKPFKVGDRVVAGGKDGIVESIGLRSTRIRSLNGTQFCVPNKEMADISIENLSVRPNFKQVFSIGLVYGTPEKKMLRAVAILHEILDNKFGFDMEKLPPRIYFDTMKDWSLNITVIVWFQTVDYFEMLSLREQFNCELMRRFEAEGLEFAYPSQTVYLAGDSAHPLKLVKD